MPFAYEGGNRMKKAVATLKTLYEQGPTMPIYNENAPRELSVGKSFKEVFDEINNASIQPVFFGIREITQVVGDMQNVDIADWRKVLSVGNFVTCDYSKVEVVNQGTDGAVAEGLHTFIQRLFTQDPYQDHRSRKNATAVLAWAHGPWNPDEVKTVVKVTTDELNPGIAENLEVFPGIHTGSDGAKWMMILSVAAKGPDASFMQVWNGRMTNKGKTCTIYIPVEGQSAPVELVVHPDVAERWKILYHKRKDELTDIEMREFSMLVGALSAQAGKPVFYPKE
jgi:cell division GTPase FtsZ